MNSDDEQYLRRAIALAAYARDKGDAPFGSILVDDNGTVVAEEHNTVLSDDDISAHPEFKLALWAARHRPSPGGAGLTMYTSCQPCGMCTGAIERSGITRVVYALSTQQFGALKPTPDFAPVPQDGPALHDEARVPIDGYYG